MDSIIDWAKMNIPEMEDKVLQLIHTLYPNGIVKVIFDVVTSNCHPSMYSLCRGGELHPIDDKLDDVMYLLDVLYLESDCILWEDINTDDIWDCTFILERIESEINSRNGCTYVWAYFKVSPVRLIGSYARYT